jgi:tRNA threonylcarbamoyladenosine biosynthesis protein TsaB
MANILCIETSAAVCSVALAVNGETVAVRESDSGRNHAGNIGVFADEILRANNMGPEDLDAVAVS